METNHERHAQETREKEVIFIQLPVHQKWAGFSVFFVSTL